MPEKDDDPDEKMKKWVEGGIERWLDKRFAEFGRWSFYGILAAALGALAMFLVSANGYHK